MVGTAQRSAQGAAGGSGLILPEHVSHSQLSSWTGRCQKELQLERLQGAPVTPAWWLIGGSAVHEVTEELDRRALEFDLTPAELNVTLEIEELFEAKLLELIREEEEKSGIPQDEWIAAGYRPPQNRKYWEENGPQMVSNWLSWRERTGWPIAFIGDEPAIEYALDVTLEIRDMPRQVKGAPDRIFVLPNKELVIVDIKSGSTTPKTVLQQGEYATLLEQAGHRRPKFGTFVKVGIQPKTGGGKHLPLAPLKKYDAAYFEHLFTAYRTQLETGTFLPNVSDLCDRCGVRSACYAAGGSQSAQYDPLDPNYQGEQ
jgi:hypothetical protein